MKRRLPLLLLCAACGGEDLQTLPTLGPRASANGLDFGATLAGTSVTRALEVRNTGDEELSVSWALVAGERAVAFAILERPGPILPGGAGRFTLSFAPQDAGAYAGWLVAETNAVSPRLELRLSGIASEPPCGNAALDAGEVCDDGANDGSYGRCLPGCTGPGPRCGDSVLNGPERCDDGDANGAYGHCRADCGGPGPFCGDGAVNGGEACDPSAGPTHCCSDSCERTQCDVALYLTADDAFEVYLDGQRIGAEASWGVSWRYELPIGGGGHVLAVTAWDTQEWRHGLKALLQITGEAVHVTGQPGWKATRDDPGAGWEARGFDDSGWADAAPCAEQAAWEYTHEQPLESAAWVWSTPDCITADEIARTWYRLHFVSD